MDEPPREPQMPQTHQTGVRINRADTRTACGITVGNISVKVAAPRDATANYPGRAGALKFPPSAPIDTLTPLRPRVLVVPDTITLLDPRIILASSSFSSFFSFFFF